MENLGGICRFLRKIEKSTVGCKKICYNDSENVQKRFLEGFDE